MNLVHTTYKPLLNYYLFLQESETMAGTSRGFNNSAICVVVHHRLFMNLCSTQSWALSQKLIEQCQR